MLSGASILKNYYVKLYNSFLAQHVNSKSLLPSDDEEQNVKAFCVLAHAALEEFFENLTRDILRNSFAKYRSKTIITGQLKSKNEIDNANRCLLQLIETIVLATNFFTYNSKNKVFGKHKDLIDLVKKNRLPNATELANYTKNTSTYTEEIVIDTNDFFFNHLQNNHGASLSYLLSILIPAGISIPNKINSLNSLQYLSIHRGTFAHTSGLQNVTSAADMVNYAKDILELCFEMQNGIADLSSI